ncbi:histidine phosphatase family protein [Hymenobacter persicinus]|uniref:Histidine phosphatase family protein n=1 Tax=Hymenobacter persicinus TaxID=2025506 RepID=A0A4Q5LCE1_9BACT|nr:histidine phosphatase family protein [Hymenobacter persicinus]RYU80513.1 histidine phosphatase family protein [Hymenobacter persicinus]
MFARSLRGLFLLLFLALAGCAGSRSAGSETTVYLVRHGEKDLAPGLTDPLLTPAGEQRALALRDELGQRRIAAIFTTDTKRTRATVAPLAAKLSLTPLVYSAKDQAALAAQIRRDYAGKAVLVVGHSNTILEMVEALGAARPVSSIADAAHDYLLEVRVPAAGSPTATARRYGAPSPK